MTTTHSDATVRDGTVDTRTAPRSPWLALYVLCAGVLMIVLDQSVVNVALPSIRDDLGFSPVVAGLGGQRLPADLRRPPAASAGGSATCAATGGSSSRGRRSSRSPRSRAGWRRRAQFLVVGRVVQGLRRRGRHRCRAGADHGSLPRARPTGPRRWASSVSCCRAAARVGVLLGGVLTDLLSWHWIFLVNVPVGVAVLVAARSVLPRRRRRRGAPPPRPSRRRAGDRRTDARRLGDRRRRRGRLGVRAHPGAAGRQRRSVRGVRGARGARRRAPRSAAVFATRNLAVSQVVGTLWTAAMFGWFFLTALYLQDVRGLAPLAVGLAFLPASLMQGVCSLWVSDRLVHEVRHQTAHGRRPGPGGGRASRCWRWPRSTGRSS